MNKIHLLGLASALAIAPAFAQEISKPNVLVPEAAITTSSIGDASSWAEWKPIDARPGYYDVKTWGRETTHLLREAAARANLQLLLDDRTIPQLTKLSECKGCTPEDFLRAVAESAGLVMGRSGNTVFVVPVEDAERLLNAQKREAEITSKFSPFLDKTPSDSKNETLRTKWTAGSEPGYFDVIFHGSELVQSLQDVAAIAGEQLLLDDSIKPTPVEFVLVLQGTTPQYVLCKVAEENGLVIGHSGSIAFVLPAKNAEPILTRRKLIEELLAGHKGTSNKANIESHGYNFNFMPGPKMAPHVPADAKPFDFNGERVYHLPLNPDAK